MYRRYPATYFEDSMEKVYLTMIEFMQECGFTVIDSNATNMFVSFPYYNVTHAQVLQDPNSIHNLCLMFCDSLDAGYIFLYVFDNYDSSVSILNQSHIAKRLIEKDVDTGEEKWSAIGIAFTNIDVKTGTSMSRTSNYSDGDLVCIYNNKTLRFIYCPLNCHLYSNIWNFNEITDTCFLSYGGFTKYHLSYNKDITCVYGTAYAFNNDVAYFAVQNSLDIGCMIYCYPEASYDLEDNRWYISPYGSNPIPDTIPLSVITSFSTYSDNSSSVPTYGNLWYYGRISKIKTLLGSTLNNTSILLPLIFYCLREPKILSTWSAVGETYLINLVDMSHISPGEVIINNGIEEDYHRYIVIPANTHMSLENTSEDEEDEEDKDKPILNGEYVYLGYAIELDAKAQLLQEQSDDNLILLLKDSYRNFDRFEIIYEDINLVNWSYDDLDVLLSSEGVFNLTKDSNNRCMVYGINNKDVNSSEYRLTCAESCKINSIIGYRE